MSDLFRNQIVGFLIKRLISSPELKAHKVSLEDGHDPSSVPPSSGVHNFKDLLL